MLTNQSRVLFNRFAIKYPLILTLAKRSQSIWKLGHKEMERRLELLLSQERLVFLVGAGISIPSPSNMMPGSEFNAGVISRISPNKETEEELLNLCNSERHDRRNKGDFLRFEGLMQILHDHVDQKLNVLNCFADCDRPNENHHVLASLIHKGHYVFTTNFDALIEHACKQLHLPCFPLIIDEEFREYSSGKYPFPLFKLHGSLRRFDGKQWIDSRDSVEATLEAVGKSGDEMQFEPGKRNVITSVLREHDLVVLGYSGYDDFDIGPMLRSISSDKRIIWINHSRNERAYSWSDLETAPRDKNGNFLRKREECLRAMGTVSGGRCARKPESIFLFDVDTSDVTEVLRRQHEIAVPELGEDYLVDKGAFLDEWARVHVHSEGDRCGVAARAYDSLGRHERALAHSQEASERFAESGDRSGLSAALHQIGMIHYAKGEHKEALANYQESIRMAEELGDERSISASLHQIALVHEFRGDYDQALDNHQRSWGISEELGDRRGIAASLCEIARIHRNRGEYDEALEQYQRSLAIAQELGDRQGVSTILHNMGVTQYLKGEYDQALENYRKNLAIREALGDRHGIGTSLHEIGLVYQNRGEYDLASENYRRSLTIAEELGDRSAISASLHQMGVTHHLKGEYDEALKQYQRSLAIKQELGDRPRIFESLNQIALVHQERGEYDQALDNHHRGLATADALGDKRSMSKSLHNIGVIHYLKEDYDHALESCQRSLALKQEIGFKLGVATSFSQIGLVHLAQQHYKDAVGYLHRAAMLFRELNSPYLDKTMDILDSTRQAIGDDRFRDCLRECAGG